MVLSQALLESFQTATGAVACPLRLSIVKTLESLYSATLEDDQWRRPVEEERLAMYLLCNFLLDQQGRAQVVEACCQAIITLITNRPDSMAHLFPSQAPLSEGGFQPIVHRLLREYRCFDSRRPRTENAAVIRECCRLLTTVAEGRRGGI